MTHKWVLNGKGIYKIRLASSDKVGGKSGGFRIITYSLAEEGENFRVLLITIYDKSEQQNILKDLLIKLIDKILNS